MNKQATTHECITKAIGKFPKLAHNLCATATDEDRRKAIRAILDWRNGEIVPILTENGLASVVASRA